MIRFNLFCFLSGKKCISICPEKATENSIQMVNALDLHCRQIWRRDLGVHISFLEDIIVKPEVCQLSFSSPSPPPSLSLILISSQHPSSKDASLYFTPKPCFLSTPGAWQEVLTSMLTTMIILSLFILFFNSLPVFVVRRSSVSVRASCQSSVRKGQRYFGLMTQV